MRYFLSIVAVVVLLLVPAAQVQAAQPVAAALEMGLDQARQAIMDAARLLYVPVNKRTSQLIDTKSMRTSLSSAEFNNAAGSQYGPHYYTIRFAAFDSVSVKCDRWEWTIASNPPGILARGETGKAVKTMLFTDVYHEQHISTCSAECLKIATDFAAALNSLHHLAQTRQTIESWRRECNESRPHRALGERTPNEFACQVAASRDLTGLEEAKKLTLEVV